MTRETYFAFKKALLDSGYIYNVTKKGNYITIKPDQRLDFYGVNILPEIMEEMGSDIDFTKDGRKTIMHTEYGDLEWLSTFHFNTQIYHAKYKIVS